MFELKYIVGCPQPETRMWHGTCCSQISYSMKFSPDWHSILTFQSSSSKVKTSTTSLSFSASKSGIHGFGLTRLVDYIQFLSSSEKAIILVMCSADRHKNYSIFFSFTLRQFISSGSICRADTTSSMVE